MLLCLGFRFVASIYASLIAEPLARSATNFGVQEATSGSGDIGDQTLLASLSADVGLHTPPPPPTSETPVEKSLVDVDQAEDMGSDDPELPSINHFEKKEVTVKRKLFPEGAEKT